MQCDDAFCWWKNYMNFLYCLKNNRLKSKQFLTNVSNDIWWDKSNGGPILTLHLINKGHQSQNENYIFHWGHVGLFQNKIYKNEFCCSILDFTTLCCYYYDLSSTADWLTQCIWSLERSWVKSGPMYYVPETFSQTLCISYRVVGHRVFT